MAGGAVINRRAVIVSLSWLVAALCGCQAMQQGKHSKSDDDDDDRAVEGVHSTPPKGFFRGTRLPGAMSSEGSEIERDLGIQ